MCRYFCFVLDWPADTASSDDDPDAPPRPTLPPVPFVCLLHTRTRPSGRPMRRRCGAARPVPYGSGEQLAAEIGYGDAYRQVEMPQIDLAADPSPTRVLAPTPHLWVVFLRLSRRRPPCLMWPVGRHRRKRERRVGIGWIRTCGFRVDFQED
jgi:hypothetical protein